MSEGVIQWPGGEQAITSVDELVSWLENEIEKWKWLESCERAGNSRYIDEFKPVINGLRDGLTRLRSDPGVASEVIERVKQYYASRALLNSSTPQAKYVEQIRTSGIAKADQTAAAMVAYFLGKDLDRSPQPVDRGFLLAHFFESNIQDDLGARQRAFDDMLSRCDSATAKCQVILEGIQLTAKAASEAIHQARDSQEQRFGSETDNREQRFGAAMAAYNEHMRIAAPVDYWWTREIYHRSAATKWGIASIGFAICFIFALLLVWHTAVPDVGSLTGSMLYLQIARYYGLMLFLITVGIWAERILVRLCLTHIHLREDCAERVTMAKTFLAFISDGKVKEDSDRRLILEALFRRGGDGLVKEDAMPEIIDTLKRAATPK